MKSQIPFPIAFILSIQLAAPAMALEQSDWITPEASMDNSQQVDIVGTPTTSVAPTANAAAAAPSSMPMQSGWITQNDEVQQAEATPATKTAVASQSASAASGSASTIGQSGWITTNEQSNQNSSNQNSSQNSPNPKPYNNGNYNNYGHGTASAVGGTLGRVAGSLASAAVAVPLMMAASRMMYGGYGYGYPAYPNMFRSYGPGGYGYGSSMGSMMGSMMGGYMLQRAAYSLLRGY